MLAPVPTTGENSPGFIRVEVFGFYALLQKFVLIALSNAHRLPVNVQGIWQRTKYRLTMVELRIPFLAKSHGCKFHAVFEFDAVHVQFALFDAYLHYIVAID